MANIYTYKKIQKLREMIVVELKQYFPIITLDFLKLVEQRLQTVIMAGLIDTDIVNDVPKVIKDK
jgi:hypothetical protein